MITQDFQNLTGLSISHVYDEVDFPIERRGLYTQNPNDKTRYQMVHRMDSDKDIGLIPESHSIVPYKTLMKWMIKEFEKTGVSYKLRDSVVMEKGDLYQEYIFDKEVDNPDGNGMAALAIVKGSYVGAPLEIAFGTYRFVCSNGAMVGETVNKIRVKPNVQDLLQSSITDDLHYSFGQFTKVADLYRKLMDEDFTPYLKAYLTDYYITAGFKKMILTELRNGGNVELLKKKFKQEDFNAETIDQICTVQNSLDAWTFYNIITNITTRRCRSVGSRLRNYSSVSRVFGI